MLFFNQEYNGSQWILELSWLWIYMKDENIELQKNGSKGTSYLSAHYYGRLVWPAEIFLSQLENVASINFQGHFIFILILHTFIEAK